MGPFIHKTLEVDGFDSDDEIEIRITQEYDAFEWVDRPNAIRLRDWLTEQIERTK